MTAEHRRRLLDDLTWILRNTLCHGPIRYHPPTQEEADKMKITLEEAREIYDEVFASRGLVEVEPGWWDRPPPPQQR